MADLCLGTAQLGMHYGINNKVGKLEKSEVFNILDTAIGNGIQMIDTASIYGEAEELLGNYLVEHKEVCKKVKIITKQCNSIEGKSFAQVDKEIRCELEESLRRLKRNAIDGYLLHLYREVDNAHTLKVLQKLKEEGIVKNIGVSVYDVDEAEIAIQSGEIDYLQMPCSIFDQRGLTSGVFEKAKKAGVTVFTRSAFLQGLLMMDTKDVPANLKGIVPYLQTFENLLKEYELDRKHAIIKFILEKECIDYMVFGVETEEQLRDIVQEKKEMNLPEAFVKRVEKSFNVISERLILPIFWG